MQQLNSPQSLQPFSSYKQDLVWHKDAKHQGSSLLKRQLSNKPLNSSEVFVYT